MKTHLILPGLLLMATTVTTNAQTTSSTPGNGATEFRELIIQVESQPATIPDNGVYLTAGDYMNRQLTDAFSNGTTNEKIWAGTPGGSVVVKTPDVTEKFPEAKIWGYRNNDKDYRIVNGLTYEIINNNDVLVYQIVKPDPNEFRYSSPYFFSRYADSDLLFLNERNLDLVYSDYPAFVHTLRQYDRKWSRNTAEPVAVDTALYFFHHPVSDNKSQAE